MMMARVMLLMITVDMVKGMLTRTARMLLVCLSLYLCTLTTTIIRDKNMAAKYIMSKSEGWLMPSNQFKYKTHFVE